MEFTDVGFQVEWRKVYVRAYCAWVCAFEFRCFFFFGFPIDGAVRSCLVALS